mgnify:CR=1 FL=1
MTTRTTPPQDTGRPAFFKPEGHDLVGTFDPERLDPFPGTRARYDALVAQARSPTARRQLGNVAHALLQLHKGGARILGPSAVGAVTQKCGGPSVKALSNATSAHHQALIAAFNEETGAAAGKVDPKPAQCLAAGAPVALIAMRRRRSGASAARGSVTVSTPLRNVASALSSSTGTGRAIARSKRP